MDHSTPNSQRQLRELLGGLLQELSVRHREKRAPSVLGIGANVWFNGVHVSRSHLLAPRLQPSATSILESLSQDALRSSSNSEALREHGELALRLRDHPALHPGLPEARYFFALERADAPAGARIQVWAVSTQAPRTPFSPLVLRTTLDRVQSLLATTSESPSLELFRLAVVNGAIADSLGVLAAIHGLDGLAVWEYAQGERSFVTVATHGMDSRSLHVPATPPTDSQHRRGIVRCVTPNRRLVVYDAKDRSVWCPPAYGDWRPWDQTLFSDRGWRSCIAVPVVIAGRLVGALSAYSTRPAGYLVNLGAELTVSAYELGTAVLVDREEVAFGEIARQYDDELITANISLGALSLTHDVLHTYTSVRRLLEQVAGYVDTEQLDMASQSIAEAEATIARAEPVIQSMRALASDARSTKTPQPAKADDIGPLATEIEILLRTILPDVARGRLEPDGVSVTVKGAARGVPLTPVALERVVVNLAVNSAQWGATEVSVVMHFDRSPQEVQIVVQDNGRGIRESVRERVFDRFFSDRDGSGLGLYVVRSIAARVGGDVFLQTLDNPDSKRHRGTIVTVAVPTHDP